MSRQLAGMRAFHRREIHRHRVLRLRVADFPPDKIFFVLWKALDVTLRG